MTTENHGYTKSSDEYLAERREKARLLRRQQNLVNGGNRRTLYSKESNCSRESEYQ